MEYSESRVFSDMIDFISRLLVVDPEKRMSAMDVMIGGGSADFEPVVSPSLNQFESSLGQYDNFGPK